MAEHTHPEELFPTGLPSLDSHIDGQGLRAESLLAVRSPAYSVGRRFVFNLCADRPVHYVAIGHDPSRYARHLRKVADFQSGELSTASIPISDPVEELVDHLDGVQGELPPETTVLLDPLTPVTDRSADSVARVLGSVRSVLSDTGGLGVVLAIDGSGQEPGRWAALSRVDAVFSIHHETTQDGVSHHVAIDRLPMGQRLREDGTSRTFEVPPHLDMTLDTSKTLSP